MNICTHTYIKECKQGVVVVVQAFNSNTQDAELAFMLPRPV